MENHEAALLDKAEVLALQQKLIALGVLKKKDQFRLISTLLYTFEQKETFEQVMKEILKYQEIEETFPHFARFTELAKTALQKG